MLLLEIKVVIDECDDDDYDCYTIIMMMILVMVMMMMMMLYMIVYFTLVCINTDNYNHAYFIKELHMPFHMHNQKDYLLVLH